MVWQQITLSLSDIKAYFQQIDWHDLNDLLSPALIAACASFVIANVLKILILTIKKHRPKASEISQTIRGGGMPSSHSATVAGLTMAIGIVDGFGSSVFALSVIFSVIVMVDATQVRRAVGEQGETLQALMDSDAGPAPQDSHPHRAIGHKPSEVVVGVGIGLVCGLLVAIAMASS